MESLFVLESYSDESDVLITVDAVNKLSFLIGASVDGRYEKSHFSMLGYFQLTHSFPMQPYGFLMFSGGRERVPWERVG